MPTGSYASMRSRSTRDPERISNFLLPRSFAHTVHAKLLAMALLCLSWLSVSGAAREHLELHPVRIDLPAAPAAVIPADLDEDGRRDLLIVLAYPDWEEIGEDRVEGVMEVMEVVPALFEKREARAWMAMPEGGYRAVPTPLPLPTSVISAEPGPPGIPVLLLTDDGVSALRLKEGALLAEPLLREPPVGAGGGSFVPRLGMVLELDGDGRADVLLPAREGPVIHLGTPDGLASTAVSRLRLPGDRRLAGRRPRRTYPMPRVGDLDGDRVPDLAVHASGEEGSTLHVLRGLGGGRFSAPASVDLEALGVDTIGEGSRQLAFFGDLDGDGVAELVTREESGSARGELKRAKKPTLHYRFHRMKEGRVEPEPDRTLDVVGHALHFEGEASEAAAFQDLDGDGRKDLVTVTFDFSVFQIMRVLTTKRMSLGLEFHVYAQGQDGSFRPVPGLDLSETLRLDLKDLSLGSFAQFQGDFDGDGRVDFLHLGRGTTVTVHRGQPGCRYPKKPDLSIELQRPIEDLALVRVEDVDGDGLSDLTITRPGVADEPGVSPPVTLDLYLTGSGR